MEDDSGDLGPKATSKGASVLSDRSTPPCVLRMRSTPRRPAGERLRRAGRQLLDPVDWRAGAAIEDLDQRGVPASGCRDDIGPAIVVHVADGEREPAVEYAVERDERPEDAAGGA